MHVELGRLSVLLDYYKKNVLLLSRKIFYQPQDKHVSNQCRWLIILLLPQTALVCQ